MRAVLSFGARKHRHFLIAAGVLMAASAILVAMPLQHKAAVMAKPAPVPVQMMMVAARPIAAGAILASQDVRGEPVVGAAPPGALFSADAVTGRIAEKAFTAGDTLVAADLRDATGIAGQVAAGQRAFAIRVAQDEIVGGFLQSADHVDVLATIPGSVFPSKNAQDHPDRSRTVLLLQDILVLAVGENLATKGSVQPTAQTVSLSLTPPQLSRLTLALRFGKISLAIRNPGDRELAQTASVTLADLVPDWTETAKPAGPARPAAPVHSRVSGILLYSGTRTILVRGDQTP